MDEMDEAARIELGRQIERARQKLRLTLSRVAELAGYDERTVRNAIQGRKTRLATLEDICKAVHLPFENAPAAQVQGRISGRQYGAYTLEQYEEYFGFYYAYRRSFTYSRSMLCTLYEFQWSDEKGCLVFIETQRYESQNDRMVDYSQNGEIFISNAIGLLHLLTIHRGALRLVTLTKLRVDDFTMHGLVLTQAQRSYYFQPCVSPIFFQKADASFKYEDLAKRVGPIRPGHEEYDRVNAMLAEAERNIGVFALAPQPFGSPSEVVTTLPRSGSAVLR